MTGRYANADASSDGNGNDGNDGIDGNGTDGPAAAVSAAAGAAAAEAGVPEAPVAAAAAAAAATPAAGGTGTAVRCQPYAAKPPPPGLFPARAGAAVVSPLVPAAQPRAAPTPPQRIRSPLRVLVVDDDLLNVMVMRNKIAQVRFYHLSGYPPQHRWRTTLWPRAVSKMQDRSRRVARPQVPVG
jgi:hypothetical protein